MSSNLSSTMSSNSSMRLLLLVVLVGAARGWECPGPGLHPAPGSCSTFYQCSAHLSAHLLTCPAGTLYDETLGLCNHQHLVTCEDTATATTTTAAWAVTEVNLPTDNVPVTRPADNNGEEDNSNNSGIDGEDNNSNNSEDNSNNIGDNNGDNSLDNSH